MRILGIDPGTSNLGWGLIEIDRNANIQHVEYGCLISPPKLNFYDRLAFMDQELSSLILELRPDRAVIEKIFLGKNVDSAFKLGHIRGICAARCRVQKLQLEEYAARTIKKAIVGSGAASKEVVQSFLSQQLRLKRPMTSLDASDALALAFYSVLHNSEKIKRGRLNTL